jgi:Tfp pilus assembly protein PilF
MLSRLTAALPLIALAGCASLFQAGKGTAMLGTGLRQYEEGEYVRSAKNLQGALDQGLSDAESARAHKHLAFIHCASAREHACRDEFRKALAFAPSLELAPSEAGHPAWGPIFRSVKAEATPLSTGLHQFDDGDYADSAKNLQGAIDRGLPNKERANAHKHLAFIHCASNRERLCRDEFRRALAFAPSLELAPSEAGHPVWGPIFRSVKAEVTPLSIGLQQFDDGDYAESAKNLQGALDQGLSDAESARAHKHLAFIHCASAREHACRDEFRKALAFAPSLELAPSEAGHPAWGPIFRSVKAEAAPLKVGLQQFDDGDYAESAKNLQSAIDRGLPNKERANAHKHLAFIHCASNRERLCRDEFRKALALDPALDLAPAEAGHPLWGPVFRSLKAGQ